MIYALDRYPDFVNDADLYFSDLAEFGDDVARGHYQRFESSLREIIRGDPHRYSHFRETGAPYRAKLFRVGRKTFWIIYTVEGEIVGLRRFWDTERRPGTHGLKDR